jgi:hypothetical protein
MRVSPGRILAVTVGLVLTGAICGAILGGLSSVVEITAERGLVMLRAWLMVFTLGAFFGAIVGAVLTPLLAWIFLRRVSLARAIGQTGLGVIVGVVIAAVFQPAFGVFYGVVGFVVAAVWLWLSTRRTASATSHPI